MTVNEYSILIPAEWTAGLLDEVHNGTISLRQAKEVHRKYFKERLNKLKELINERHKI